MSDKPTIITFDTAQTGVLPDPSNWTFRAPKAGQWKYDPISLRLRSPTKYNVGDHVMLTHNGTAYETVIDSIVPDGETTVRVTARWLLPVFAPEGTNNE